MTWEEHVILEISEAFGNPDRLAQIAHALHEMDKAELIPEDVSHRLWLYFGDIAQQ